MPPEPHAPTGGYYPRAPHPSGAGWLPQAIEAAARRGLTSPSEYVRRAVLNALKADGVHMGAEGQTKTAR